MTPERWQQVKSTLGDALEQPTKDRASFLASSCTDDTSLRREVQSLLDQPPDEFETVANVIGITRAAPTGSTGVGLHVGSYQLLHELGRGGMGTVWLAKRADQQFEKLVAIKLLKRGTDTDEVLRRFQAERQILARLEHQYIARLFDGGVTDDGLPYFVMEYVEGKLLTEFCRAHSLGVEERLRLFLKICEAVQFAHQNLVVHRDLKPGNILVTEEGEPKLLDFGIAKLLASAEAAPEVTMIEQQRLTPAYASPEQVRGDSITTISDVYTLGTVLYEVLTGQTAHRFSTPHPPPTDLLRVVTQQEPLRPSAAATDPVIQRRLRGDLDNIILKALRKEPARRYLGVGSFSEDIRRHLQHRPIVARKATFGYRTTKFVQRNKIGVATAALVLLTLVGGIIGTASQARRANRRFNDVRRLAHSVLFDYHDAIASLPGSTPVREKLVRDSLAYLDRLAQEGGSDRSLQREIASAYLKVGDVQGRPNFPNLGDATGALESYRKALRFCERLVAAEPVDAELKSEVAATYTRIGEVLRNGGNLNAAVESNRKAVAVMEDVAAHTNKADVREALALSYVTLGDVLGNPYTANLGDVNGALEKYRHALAIREKIMTEEPGNPERRRWAAVSHQRLGNMLQTIKNPAGALEHYRKALAIDDSVLQKNPNDTFSQRSVGIDYQLLALASLEAGDLEQARDFQAKNIAIWEQMAQVDTKNAVAQSDLALGYSRMIAVLAKTGDTAGAINYYEKSMAILTELLAREPNNTTQLMALRGNYMRMADLFLSIGDTNGALEHARKELTIDDQMLAINPASADAHRNQAIAHAQSGQADKLAAKKPATPSDQQRQNWGNAGAEFRRSIEIWQNIAAKAGLAGTDVAKLDEVTKELAICEDALR